nr:grasp-with-spasm system ATP-grasp peptide maturase [uncultured Chitinophaga sp.]
MILILSGEGDTTTLSVVRWITAMGHPVMLVSDKDVIDDIFIENDRIILYFKGNKTLDFSEVKAYWYRRGAFMPDEAWQPRSAPEAIAAQLSTELRYIVELLHTRLAKIPNLSGHGNRRMNRLVVMDAARRVGLTVPDFGVFSQRSAVKTFADKQGKILTKPVSDVCFFNEENRSYRQYNALFTAEDIEKLPDRFMPGLFVAYVEKKYELRVFFLNGTCYTMAILSQQDPQTRVDMRHYNYQKPNRNVPYQLPPAIGDQIRRLMEQLDLNTGSIDILVTPDDHFVFLEVNPVGQFGNMSAACNYQLEREVATYLTKISNCDEHVENYL